VKKLRKVLLAIYIALSLIFCIYSAVKISEYREILNADIEENCQALDVTFGEKEAKLKAAYKLKTAAEMFCAAREVKALARENGIEMTRSNTELYGEIKLHNYLYRLGYRRDKTADCDLDYTNDRRLYINLLSKILG